MNLITSIVLTTISFSAISAIPAIGIHYAALRIANLNIDMVGLFILFFTIVMYKFLSKSVLGQD